MDAAGKMFGVVLFNEFLIGINLARSSKTINRVPVQTPTDDGLGGPSDDSAHPALLLGGVRFR